MAINLTLTAALALVLTSVTHAYCAQASRHKTESEVAQMTPEQRVREACEEYYYHELWHREYMKLLENYIFRDGLKAVPALIKAINDFDPTSGNGKSKDKDASAFEAEVLLGSLDRFFRLRAFNEGKEAIDALKREAERMRAAHFDTASDEAEYSRRARYETTLDILKRLHGISNYDRSIADTLELRYKIKSSDEELLGFSNYLISQDPYYPQWSEMEWYVDHNKLNEYGNPEQYSVIKNIEPFYKAYSKFKGKRQ
jgi:hypothetical protein